MIGWLRKSGEGSSIKSGEAVVAEQLSESLVRDFKQVRDRPDQNEILGTFIAQAHQRSDTMIGNVSVLRRQLDDFLGVFRDTLEEIGALRSERARLAALVESLTRVKDEFSSQNIRFSEENKTLKVNRLELAQKLERERNENHVLHANNKSLSEEAEEIRKRLDGVQGELDATILALETAQREGERVQAELVVMQDKAHRLSAALETERTNHQLLAERTAPEIEQLEKQVTELGKLNGKLLNERTRAEQRIETIERELQATQKLAIEAEQRYQSVNDELDLTRSDFGGQLARLSAKNEAIEARAALADRLLDAARKRNSGHEAEAQQLRRELQVARADIQEKATRADNLAEALSRSQSENAQLSRSHKELERSLTQVSSKLEEAVDRRQKVDLECGRLREEIGDLNRQYMGESEQMATRVGVAEAQLRKAMAECEVLKGRIEHLEMQRKSFGRPDRIEGGEQRNGPNTLDALEAVVPATARATGLNVVAISEITAKSEAQAE